MRGQGHAAVEETEFSGKAKCAGFMRGTSACCTWAWGRGAKIEAANVRSRRVAHVLSQERSRDHLAAAARRVAAVRGPAVEGCLLADYRFSGQFGEENRNLCGTSRCMCWPAMPRPPKRAVRVARPWRKRPNCRPRCRQPPGKSPLSRDLADQAESSGALWIQVSVLREKVLARAIWRLARRGAGQRAPAAVDTSSRIAAVRSGSAGWRWWAGEFTFDHRRHFHQAGRRHGGDDL